MATDPTPETFLAKQEEPDPLPACPACGSPVRRIETTDPDLAPVGLCGAGHLVPLAWTPPAPLGSEARQRRDLGAEARRLEEIDDAAAFAAWVKDGRRRLGISQAALAKLVGCDPQTISNLERAYTKAPTSREFRALVYLLVAAELSKA